MNAVGAADIESGCLETRRNTKRRSRLINCAGKMTGEGEGARKKGVETVVGPYVSNNS